MSISTVSVFCGTGMGRSDGYLAAARDLAEELAANRVTIVYGGASVGLMGAVADAALAAGGVVIGVMPQSLLDAELAHVGLTELHVVDSMHERKALMAELSDAALALPGGAGTLDEWFESWTWGQLGIDTSPTALLNTNRYFDHLIAQLDHMVSEGFVRQEHRDMLIVAASPAEVLPRLSAYEGPAVKWAS